jgi:hypothetical protein
VIWPGEADVRAGTQPHLGVEERGELMKVLRWMPPRRAKARVLEARNPPEDIGLRAILHLGLEAHDVVERAERVVAAQLDDGIGLHVGRCGFVSPTGFIGPKRSVSRPRSAMTSIGRQPSK